MSTFTDKEKEDITTFLSYATNKDKVFTLDKIHGLLFGLALLDVPVEYSKWVSIICAGEMPKVNNEEELKHHLLNLIAVRSRIFQQNKEGNLSFPYSIDIYNKNNLVQIEEWARGLFAAASYKIRVWIADKADDKLTNSRMIECFTILTWVAFPERRPEQSYFVKRYLIAFDIPESEIEGHVFRMLPDAVAYIQKYANTAREGVGVLKADNYEQQFQPRFVEKIGRNSLCSCGSGAKYKKCCGK
jgi:uncharacterized protein YecA (UPF0149 family)